MSSPVPGEAAKLVNAVVEAYLKHAQATYDTSTQKRIDLLKVTRERAARRGREAADARPGALRADRREDVDERQGPEQHLARRLQAAERGADQRRDHGDHGQGQARPAPQPQGAAPAAGRRREQIQIAGHRHVPVAPGGRWRSRTRIDQADAEAQGGRAARPERTATRRTSTPTKRLKELNAPARGPLAAARTRAQAAAGRHARSTSAVENAIKEAEIDLAVQDGPAGDAPEPARPGPDREQGRTRPSRTSWSTPSATSSAPSRSSTGSRRP